ncbi:MAG: hypothetical protein IJ311_05290 [Elusimicrobiaceae bacterium]|nr:hypothetical protein [Elusimicrobiaceae bacterium]
MRKILFVLCVALFLTACAIVQKIPGSTDETAQKRPSLVEINKTAQDISTEFFEREKQNSLNEEEKEILNKWNNAKDDEEMKYLFQYADRNIELSDLITMRLGLDAGYTEQELDEFLKLGLYVKNPYCEDEFKSYKVFQVLEDFVLAHGCEITSYDKCSIYHGRIFMFPKQGEEIYFDKKILYPSDNSCSVYAGIFTYENNAGNINTVPILLFLSKTIDKKQLELIKKMREETQTRKE